jgi:hypothetical protein
MCEARTEAERKGLENRIDRTLSEVMGPLWQGL